MGSGVWGEGVRVTVAVLVFVGEGNWMYEWVCGVMCRYLGHYTCM